MDENLVGYLLKALGPDEQRKVEDYLRQHPEAHKRLDQLRQRLDVLGQDADESDPPAGLWVRALARVAEHKCRTLPAAPPPAARTGAGRAWWRRADLLVAAALLVVVGGLGVVWLAGFGEKRHRVECANNLRRFHQALLAYADKDPEGRFPWVESQPPRNFAGSFVPALNEAGVLPADLSVNCPASEPRRPSSITFAELDDLRRRQRDEYHDVTRGLGGCYAYALGYQDPASGSHLGLTRRMDGQLPIMSDAPPCRSGNDVSAGNSPNHGGQGQNVLYVDGHVAFKETRNVGLDGDDIFLNADQRCRAGRGPRDTVLGRSDAVPYPMLDE
jgi:prepilin-type processing-associated H-X9-DG protein